MIMKKFAATLTIAALGFLGAVPATAEMTEEATIDSSVEARIPFANRGGIRNWRVGEDNTLLIEGRLNRWYRAEFFGRCHGLRFSNTIGFETRGIGSFDRFGTIRTRDDRCQLRSLTRIPDPDADTAEEQDNS